MNGSTETAQRQRVLARAEFQVATGSRKLKSGIEILKCLQDLMNVVWMCILPSYPMLEYVEGVLDPRVIIKIRINH